MTPDSRYNWLRTPPKPGPHVDRVTRRWLHAWDRWEARVVGFRLAALLFVLAGCVGPFFLPRVHVWKWLAAFTVGALGSALATTVWATWAAPSLDEHLDALAKAHEDDAEVGGE